MKSLGCPNKACPPASAGSIICYGLYNTNSGKRRRYGCRSCGGAGRLKTDYLAYEAVASVIGNHSACRERAAVLLEAITRGCLGAYDGCALVECDKGRTTEHSVVLRLLP